MGCYGLGVSRILAASVQVFSHNDSIRWPIALAPFKICFILPKVLNIILYFDCLKIIQFYVFY